MVRETKAPKPEKAPRKTEKLIRKPETEQPKPV